MLEQSFDPLLLVLPIILTARVLSGSVQFARRFLDAGERGVERPAAVVEAGCALFKPGLLAAVTGAASVAVVYALPVPLLQKLSLLAGCWLLSSCLSGILLAPALASVLPASARERSVGIRWLDRTTERLGALCTGPRRTLVLFSALALCVASAALATQLTVGNVSAGTPLLWPDSRYNLDTRAVAERFGIADQLTVVVETETDEVLLEPEVLATIEAFQRHMDQLPEVTTSSSIVDLVPGVVSLFHGLDPKFELVPDIRRESAFFMESILSSGQPGDLASYVTPNRRLLNITLFLSDHRGSTLTKVVEHAREFIATRPVPGATLRLAGGYGGLLAAINERVAPLDLRITLGGLAAVLLCCALAYRSLTAGLVLLVPVVLANAVAYAWMALTEVGLDVNALAVVALGVALTADHGIYVLDAALRAQASGRAAQQALQEGVRAGGRGVFVTGLVVTLALACWRLSFLRFHAEMGMLLMLWNCVSILGALTVLPALLSRLEPKFLGASARAVPVQPTMPAATA